MKPRVAFFDFASCEGCQLAVVNLENELLDLVSHIDIVNFREAMTEASDDYDIAFIEGSVTREYDIPRLKKIRENAKLVVPIGACACTGGVNFRKNFYDLNEIRHYVYGDSAKYFDTFATRPVKAVIPVDFEIPGCPINAKEFLSVVKSLLIGKKPELPNYSVCVECKLAGNVCMYDKGETCLGPVTRAGCGAWCPSNGSGCEGCRGLVDEPNKNSAKDVLVKAGLSVEDAMQKFKIFAGYFEEVKK